MSGEYVTVRAEIANVGDLHGKEVGTLSAGFHPMDFLIGGTTMTIIGPIGVSYHSRRQLRRFERTHESDSEGVEDDW
jgi:hypothetical protein